MSGTSGSCAGTSRRRRLGWLVATAVALVISAVNAASTLHDAGGAGARLDAWEPWVWELSSSSFWILVMPLLWSVARWLRPPHLPWPGTAAAYLALTLPVSAVHLLWMAALRPPIYTLLGSHYTPDWSATQLLYEYRKDLLVALMLIGVGVLIDLWAAAASPVAAIALPWRLEVRDGSRRHWFTATEIERVEAAGNYVELHTARGPVLHRATLASVEAELAIHGFVRIHRSRLVRRDAVTAVAGTPSGDFEATLAGGAVVAGSRRFRAALG